MTVIGTMISVAILWFLITLLTGSRDAEQSLRETWIVMIGVMIVGVLSRLLLEPYLGPFTGLLQIVALYFLIDWVCGCNRKTTFRICAYYAAACVMISIVIHIFNMPTPGG